MTIDIETEISTIKSLKKQMRECLGTLPEQRDKLDEQIRSTMDPFVAKIQAHEDNIKNATLMLEKSYKGEDGSRVTFRRESVRTSWDTKALEGYAAGGHDEILQFKKETVVKPNVSISIAEVE